MVLNYYNIQHNNGKIKIKNLNLHHYKIFNEKK